MSSIRGQTQEVVGPRERLQELFREIYSVVDSLVDENIERMCRLFCESKMDYFH